MKCKDDALDADLAAEVLEVCRRARMRQHVFEFGGRVFPKPGIFEVEGQEINEPALERAEAAVRIIVGAGPDAAAAVKLQRNTGGGFPAHYDNAGPPSRRAVTAILYLTDGDSGMLEIFEFLKPPVRVAPRFNRLVVFASDRCLHAVTRWREPTPRYAVTFWFDGRAASEEIVLTKSHLSGFPTWDDAVAFFQESPLQRVISRAVYDDEYETSLREYCGFREDHLAHMLEAHRRSGTAAAACSR
ncbi:hypothetical protein CTAYLR_007519 [Chrysophaeum taylorii]|uniref:Fe2OG dioxygenase domain-containing protein n=1 Tax=Chrysophaeum taylorii TaxID=2483200 RepID=A0AAD7XI25_9STRA|nr:hypothetical protein CTAYLR_007519 [Chrysophaeum taylorii]